MKMLTLIVHTDVQKDMVELLRSLDEVPGYTFSHVEGHGQELETDGYLSARDSVVGYTSRIRIEILLEDDDIDSVLANLCNNNSCVAGKGIYWITPVEKGGHLK